MSKKPIRSFGPAVVVREDDGIFRPVCTYCMFRVHRTCTYLKPVRNLPSGEDTPDWCEMRESSLDDARQMAARSA